MTFPIPAGLPAPAATSCACSAYGHSLRVSRARAPRGAGEAVLVELDSPSAAFTPEEAIRFADGVKAAAREALRRNAALAPAEA